MGDNHKVVLRSIVIVTWTQSIELLVLYFFMQTSWLCGPRHKYWSSSGAMLDQRRRRWGWQQMVKDHQEGQVTRCSPRCALCAPVLCSRCPPRNQLFTVSHWCQIHPAAVTTGQQKLTKYVITGVWPPFKHSWLKNGDKNAMRFNLWS